MGHSSSKAKGDTVAVTNTGEYDRLYEITGLTGCRYPTEKEVAEEMGRLKGNYLRGTLSTQVKDNKDGSYTVTCTNSRPWLEREVVGIEKEFKAVSKRRSWSISLLSSPITCSQAPTTAGIS
ncbi:hypothetical protein IAT40_007271 [Kwoniella sp. CBS 6097]